MLKSIWRIIKESSVLAVHELISNKLRTILSLTGITIGIICVIGATSAVESLEKSVKDSFKKMGDDIVYIQKWPWDGGSGKWWDYFQRPEPNLKEYDFLKSRMSTASDVGFYAQLGYATLKTPKSTINNTFLLGVSDNLFNIILKDFESGRMLTPSEVKSGVPKAVLGNKIAQELFGSINPIGKKIKLKGYKVEVIGVLQKEGESIINVMDFDEVALIGLEFGKKFGSYTTKTTVETTITIKAKSGFDISEVIDEATGVVRAFRKTKPKESDSFALNRLTMLEDIIGNIFAMLNMSGLLIGFFSILVGMFSVANIMFVSVKERTNLIGIKKALGAQNYFVLLEFLIESIILSLIGGLIGLFFIQILSFILTAISPFPFFLSLKNILVGISLSIGIGIIAGFIPAYQASRMDPVEAMRH